MCIEFCKTLHKVFMITERISGNYATLETTGHNFKISFLFEIIHYY